LRGFERVTLQPGERKKIRFTIRPEALALLDKNMKWTVERGQFKVMIGNSSVDIKLSKIFTIQ
jgi:beta-glucosidase